MPIRDSRIDQKVLDALTSLGNRHRLSVLLALAEAGWTDRNHLRTMTFTELYKAVDIESSSQFTYHLNQLENTFVVETANGYRLTYSGRKVVRSLMSGVYESTSSFEPEDVSSVCVVCDETSLQAIIENELFTVRCQSCETTHITVPFPRSLTRERTTPEIIESIGYYIWGSYIQLQGGVCPECYGRTETAMQSHDLGRKTLYTLRTSCLNCHLEVSFPLEVAGLFHPIAMYAFWKRGVNVIEMPLWELFRYIVSDDIVTEVLCEEPFEATVIVTVTGEEHLFQVEEPFSVTPFE